MGVLGCCVLLVEIIHYLGKVVRVQQRWLNFLFIGLGMRYVRIKVLCVKIVLHQVLGCRILGQKFNSLSVLLLILTLLIEPAETVVPSSILGRIRRNSSIIVRFFIFLNSLVAFGYIMAFASRLNTQL